MKVDPGLLGELYTRGVPLAVIAERFDCSPRTVQAHLTRLQLPRRPRPLRSEGLDVDQLRVLYVEESLSVRAIADRLNTTSDKVSLRLIRAGIERRRPGRPSQQLPPLAKRSLASAYVTRRESITEIAARFGCSEHHARNELRRHGIGRSRTQQLPPGCIELSPQLLQRWYVRDELTLEQISERAGGSPARAQVALRRAGIPARAPGTVPKRRLQPLMKEVLHQLYVVEELSTAQIAERMGGQASRVRNALIRAGIPRRPRTRPPTRLGIPRDELEDLYVGQRASADTIAATHGVSTYQVRLRLRAEGIRRPNGSPPRLPPSPPPATLRRLYVKEGHTLSELAARYRTSKPKVRAWLEAVEITVTPRTSRADRLQLPATEIADDYWESGCSAAEIAADRGTTVTQVLRALHEGGVPVRIGFRRTESICVLDRLYGDRQIVELLRRHDIPVVPQPGTLLERFPTPAGLSAELLRAMYLDVGISARHIELLTGQPHEHVLDRLRRAGVPVRSPSDLSPWRRRQVAAAIA